MHAVDKIVVDVDPYVMDSFIPQKALAGCVLVVGLGPKNVIMLDHISSSKSDSRVTDCSGESRTVNAFCVMILIRQFAVAYPMRVLRSAPSLMWSVQTIYQLSWHISFPRKVHCP
jgi:hypothetical protein